MNNTATMNQIYGGGMYGGSFIDILFRQVMQHGWEGFNIMFIFYFYAYLSLERIKAGFVKLNDKLAEKGQQLIDNYGNRTTNYMLKIWSKYNILRIPRLLGKRQQQAPINLLPSIPAPNKFTTRLIDKNKLDILALGNHLLKKDGWTFKNSRVASDRYKTSESFAVPEEISWNYNNVDVTFKQQVELQLICETTSDTETVKDFDVTILDNSIKVVSGNEFMNYYNIWVNKNELCCPSTTLPKFSFKSYNVCPLNLCNRNFYTMLLFIFYKNDVQLLDRLIKFFNCTGSWYMDGTEFKLNSVYRVMPEYFLDNKEYEKIKDCFFEKFQEYCENLIKEFEKDENDKKIIEQFVKKNKHTFDIVEKFVPAFELTFESNVLTPNDLAIVSRNMMQEFIMDYYQQNTSNDGRVSVYKLVIGYETIIKEKPNPAYESWFDHYGSSTDADEKDDKPRYRMYAPAKTLKEEVPVPKVCCHHIKTDSKPFQYLYLQEKERELLHSYLKNFKNNKDNYTKFGFPYKGGVILSGTPGCGKTSAIMAIATFLNKDVFYIDLGQMGTNNELKMCMDHIKSAQNGGVIIFEDIDCMTSIVLRRDNDINTQKPNAKDMLSLSFLLNVIDGTMAPENVIFVMTTNHIEKLDPALIRPGRMDISIELQKCSRYQLAHIFKDLYNRELKQELLDKFPEDTYITAEVILHLFHNIYSKETNDEKILAKFL